METILPYMDAIAGVTACVGVLWWVIALTTKSFSQRRREAVSRRTSARQPWALDKAGGRGNR